MTGAAGLGVCAILVLFGLSLLAQSACCGLGFSDVVALAIQLVPPVTTVSTLAQAGFTKEKEVEEFVPHQEAILLGVTKLHAIVKLPLIFVAQRPHQLRVLGELLDQVSLRDVGLALELGVVFCRVSLDGVEHPLKEEECHLICASHSQSTERVCACLLSTGKLLLAQVCRSHEVFRVVLS